MLVYFPIFIGELRGECESVRDDVFCEYYKTKLTGELVSFASMLFDGRYKISSVHHLAPSFSQDVMGELYDLETDACERRNLFYDENYISLKAAMLEKLCDRQAMCADPLPIKSAPW